MCRLSCTAPLILSINELSSTLLPRTPSINHNLSSVLLSPHSPSLPPSPFLPLLLFLLSKPHYPSSNSPIPPVIFPSLASEFSAQGLFLNLLCFLDLSLFFFSVLLFLLASPSSALTLFPLLRLCPSTVWSSIQSGFSPLKSTS